MRHEPDSSNLLRTFNLIWFLTNSRLTSVALTLTAVLQKLSHDPLNEEGNGTAADAKDTTKAR